MSLQSFLQTICTRCVYTSGSQQLFQRTKMFLNIHYGVLQKLKLSPSLYYKFYKLQKFENFATILLVGNQKIMKGWEPLLYTLINKCQQVAKESRATMFPAGWAGFLECLNQKYLSAFWACNNFPLFYI